MKRTAMAAIGGAAGALLLVGAFFGGYELAHRNTASATAPRSQPPVTSTSTRSASSTPTPPTTITTTTTTTTTLAPVRIVATSTTPHSVPRLVMYTCTGSAVSAPASFELACADYGIELQALQWSGWGQSVAHASGNLVENNCVPDCADGTDIPYPASVEVAAASGERYTWMHVSVPQAPGGPYDYTLSTHGPS